MSTSTAPDESLTTVRRSRAAVAVVFAVIAVVFFAAAIVMIVVPAHALPLPHVLAGDGSGHHPLRVAGCLIVGAVFAVSSWFALKYRETPEDHPEEDPGSH